jgi:hypothetical protein
VSLPADLLDGVTATDLCAVRSGLVVVQDSPRRWSVFAVMSGPFGHRDVFHGRRVFGPGTKYEAEQFVSRYGFR